MSVVSVYDLLKENVRPEAHNESGEFPNLPMSKRVTKANEKNCDQRTSQGTQNFVTCLVWMDRLPIPGVL